MMMKKKGNFGIKNKKKRPEIVRKPKNDSKSEKFLFENPLEKKNEEDENNPEKSEMEEMIRKQNKKNKKSGGFQSMGLSQDVFRGVIRKGYRVPTPIQRKTIPLILEGRDVVAMARTGSGKTAAFLIPLFQKLKARSAKAGARALILSPTKELALQTRKFLNELGKYTGLRSACVLGGESMEKQFGLIHENPDIIVATPGRFVHLCVEMGLRLEEVEYVVFDEADRLFEMGFGEQLREILSRLPDARQTVLFSATLPKLLVEFAKAGLSDPSLVRLDVDTKIPDTLKLAFFHCRPEGKSCVLLHLLKNVLPKEEQTVVFCETRHHVEYLHALLDMADITNTYIYSHLDSAARKINAAKFQAKKARILLVTDLAARGIDIPLLDNVINFNFPAQSKLFVHRVGRVARAGRKGTSFSLIAGDEMAYFIDLQLFLGNKVDIMSMHDGSNKDDWHNKIGQVPQSIYDSFTDQIHNYHEASQELNSLKEVSEKGHLKYLKSRQSASNESVRRVKKLKEFVMGTHPIFVDKTKVTENDVKRDNFLEEMKKFRPSATIFEIGNNAKSSAVRSVMTKKRTKHENTISMFNLQRNERRAENEKSEKEILQSRKDLEQSSQDELQSAFSKIINPKAAFPKSVQVFDKKKKMKRKFEKDEENYIGYQAKDFHTEAGYSLMSQFEAQASGAILDLTGDDDAAKRMRQNAMKWDAKKKKYVNANDGNKKKIKTESGVWIPASYKSDRYSKWKERSKLTQKQDQEFEEEQQQGDQKRGTKRPWDAAENFESLPFNHPAMKKAREAVPKHKKGPKFELKRPEQVLKQRILDDKKRANNERKSKKGKGNRRRK